MAEGGNDRALSDTKSVPGQTILYSHHSRNYVESVSVEICTIMTRLAYGEEMKRWRVEKYRESDRLGNKRRSDLTLITSGSMGEGLACFLESDHDYLYVLIGVICVESGINPQTIPYDMEVFRMDTRVYPGHCRLFLQRRGSRYCRTIDNALCDNGNGDVIFSSDLFIDELSKHPLRYPQENVQRERAGPSIPMLCRGVIQIDRVIALHCHCPSIFETWAARPRHWPPPAIVQKVVSLGAYLTPVGFRGSEYKHMEWRICFNTGEIELVNNLNDTQAHVYVLLKMILKNVLRPCKKEIASFIMKNIVLWQAESNPQNAFNARSLLHWLQDGLRELRTAIVTQRLPYYMIPERNLMAASGLQDKQQIKWVADITDMIAEGPRVILRLPKIRQAVVASPEPLLWFSRRRMELEMLILEMRIRDKQCRDENGEVGESDAVLQELIGRMVEIMMEVAQRMLLKESAVDALMDIFIRILM